MMYRRYCFSDLETGCIFCDLQAEAEETADDVITTIEHEYKSSEQGRTGKTVGNEKNLQPQ